MIDGLNCHWIPGRDPDERDRTIDAVHCYPKVVFISKGANKPVHRPHELKMMQASVSDRQPPSPGQPTGHGASDPGATPPGPIPTPHDRGERGGEGSGPPLLIAAIYAPSALNARWYALQRRFIAKTTAVGYDFKVFLNGVDPAGFEATEIMAALKGNEGHSHALGHVLAHFKEHRYQAYLILDSDCFPVRKGWHDVLANQMHRFNKDFAAPVRAENLDLFPHPSAVFMRRNALDDGRLDFTRSPRRNLLGEEVQDVGSAMQDLGGALLPLLRTNVVNVHPVAAAIYHHLFYHHGAGSRDFGFRILRRFRYYEHWYDPRTEPSHGDELLEALLRDPDAFVDTLMGRREPLIRGHLLWPGPRE